MKHPCRPAHAPEQRSIRRTGCLSRHYRNAIVRAARNRRNRRFALHHLFSTYLSADILCLVTFEDHEIFINPRDDKIAFAILSGRPWQRRQFELALAVALRSGRIQTGGLFIDVGANIGSITLYALLSGQFRHVLAIEPDPLNRAILQRNIMHNGFTDNVTIISAAASCTGGTLPFYRDAKNLGAHSLEAGFSRSQGAPRSIPVARLDDIVRDAGYATNEIGFVKIDVEGHEHAVLDGMPAILKVKPPLMVEVTYQETMDPHDGKVLFCDPNATLSRLSESHAYCTPLDEDTATSHLLMNFQPSKQQHDLLVL